MSGLILPVYLLSWYLNLRPQLASYKPQFSRDRLTYLSTTQQCQQQSPTTGVSTTSTTAMPQQPTPTTSTTLSTWSPRPPLATWLMTPMAMDHPTVRPWLTSPPSRPRSPTLESPASTWPSQTCLSQSCTLRPSTGAQYHTMNSTPGLVRYTEHLKTRWRWMDSLTPAPARDSAWDFSPTSTGTPWWSRLARTLVEVWDCIITEERCSQSVYQTLRSSFSLQTVTTETTGTQPPSARYPRAATSRYSIIKSSPTCSHRVSLMGTKQSMIWQECVLSGDILKIFFKRYPLNCYSSILST